MSVSVGTDYFHGIVSHFQNTDIKSTSAQIIDGDFFVLLFIEPVCQSGRCRFVDNSPHFQTGDFSRFLGGFSLRIVKISRYGNHRFFDFFSQFFLRIGFEFLQNHRGNFARSVFFVTHFYQNTAVFFLGNFVRHQFDILLDIRVIKIPSYQSFDRKKSVFRIGDRLSFGEKPDQSFSVFIDRYHWGGGSVALFVFYYFRLAPLHDSHRAIGGTEIDS